MKETTLPFALLIGVLLAVGCRGPQVSQFQSQAKVAVELNGQQLTQAAIDSEVKAIKSIAASYVIGSDQFDVRPIPNTGLIDVSVISSDPKASAKKCNEILNEYVGTPNDQLSKTIVERATPSAKPVR